MNARLQDQIKHFFGCQVARVNALVGLPQVNRATLIGPAVSQVSGASDLPLLWCHQCPTVGPVVSAKFSDAVTWPAFVRQSQRARSVAQEVLRVGRFNFSASMAMTSVFGVLGPLVHRAILKDGPHFGEALSRKEYVSVTLVDGPHFELDRLAYPA